MTSWEPGIEITATKREPMPFAFGFAGFLWVGRSPYSTSEVFQFADPSGRVLADCASYEALMAAYRLLVGGAP